MLNTKTILIILGIIVVIIIGFVVYKKYFKDAGLKTT